MSVPYTGLVYRNTLYRCSFLGIRDPLRGHLIVGHHDDGEQSDHD
jgi:hypothetical protein